jgi:cell division septation protein DedD
MANKNEQIDRYRVGFFQSLTPASYAILIAIAAGVVLGAGMILFDGGGKESNVIQQPRQQANAVAPQQPQAAQAPPIAPESQPIVGLSPTPPSAPTEQEWRAGIALLEGKKSDSEEPDEKTGGPTPAKSPSGVKASAEEQPGPVVADLRGQGAQVTATMPAPAPAPKPDSIGQQPTAAKPAATAPASVPAPAQAPKPEPAQPLVTVTASATAPVPSPAVPSSAPATAGAAKPDPGVQQLAAVKPAATTPAQQAPVQAEKSTGRWVVQLSVNRNQDLANGWAKRLQELGANAYVLQRKTDQGDLHVLRMGFFSSKEEAKAKAEQISAKTGLSGYSLIEAGPEEKERFAKKR